MKSRSRLWVELGALKPRWDDWCVLHDVTPAEAVRQLIIDTVEVVELQRPVVADTMRWKPVGETRARLEIRLTVSELEAVEQWAAASGFTPNRWVVAVIRAQLMHAPQFGEQEMALLAASNRSLAAISRSLGPLTRGSGLHAVAGDSDCRRYLADMKSQIDAHLRAVADLVRANIDRWSR
jgi:hypothetical protein